MHVLALDGAYTFEGERPRFHRARLPTAAELERVLDTAIRRITRTLVRSGALVAETHDDEAQPYLDPDEEGEDALTQLQGAAVRYRIAVGPIAGRRTLHLHTPGVGTEVREPPKPFTAARTGSRSTRSWPAVPTRERSSNPCAAMVLLNALFDYPFNQEALAEALGLESA